MVLQDAGVEGDIALDATNDLEQADLVRWQSQLVAATNPFVRSQEATAPKLEKYLAQERAGDAFMLGDFSCPSQFTWRLHGQIGQRPNCVRTGTREHLG